MVEISPSEAFVGGALMAGAGILLAWFAAPERSQVAGFLIKSHLDGVYATVVSALIAGGLSGAIIGLAKMTA